MRKAVIERDGVLHYALIGWTQETRMTIMCFYVFCDPSSGARRTEYRSDDIQEDFPTCVKCLGEEILRGKDLEPLEID